jgi:hypothetical protein
VCCEVGKNFSVFLCVKFMLPRVGCYNKTIKMHGFFFPVVELRKLFAMTPVQGCIIPPENVLPGYSGRSGK